jgi:biotin transport system substrate-specific component
MADGDAKESEMLHDGARRQTLADLLPASLVTDLALIAGFAVLIGVFAQFTIPLPFTPVPVSGQTFAVLLGAAALGTRRATLGSLLYLGLGLVGLPWFAGGSGGLHIAVDPTFGYLVGFIAASAMVGALAERGLDRSPWTMALVMVAGNLVIYAFGVSVLALSLHVGAAKALALGMVPFLPGDAIKLVLAVILLPGAWYLRNRLQHD